MAAPKRFSLRQGLEAVPAEPVFEVAPDRVRFFVFEFLRNNFYDHVALETVSRVFCQPELVANPRFRGLGWAAIHPQVFGCEWWLVYNLIEEIYKDLPHMGSERQPGFVDELNTVLAEESVGWRMDNNGLLQRTLPAAADERKEEVFRELQAPRFAAAWTQMSSAYKAYNARPRRDQYVCSFAFDALESVGKETLSMPTATFGDVIKASRVKQLFEPATLLVLEKLYALANSHFRHGMTEPFKLGPAEVEFVYLACIGGMLMFLRT